jgi:hypothetical protein
VPDEPVGATFSGVWGKGATSIRRARACDPRWRAGEGGRAREAWGLLAGAERRGRGATVARRRLGGGDAGRSWGRGEGVWIRAWEFLWLGAWRGDFGGPDLCRVPSRQAPDKGFLFF